MAAALVGTIGAVNLASAANSAVTPVWHATEARTAGNLLICWVDGMGAATLPGTPTGWSVAAQTAGTSCSATVFYKVAAGADSAPTIAAVASVFWAAQLAEYSGLDATSPLDQSGVNAGTGASFVATAGGVDVQVGELLVAAGVSYYSPSFPATKTISHTINNVASHIETTNNATSTYLHYDFAYAFTTAKSVADTDTYAQTTTRLTGGAVAMATFKLVPVAASLTLAASDAVASPAALDLSQTPGPVQVPLAASGAVAAPTLSLVAGWGFVQANSNIQPTATTLNCALANPVLAGDLLVAVIRQSDAALVVTRVSDDVNGQWDGVTTTANNVTIAYKLASLDAPSGLTLTVTAGASGTIRISLNHFRPPVGQTAGFGAATSHIAQLGTTSLDCGTLSTVPAGVLLFGGGASGDSLTYTAGAANGATAAIGKQQTSANGSIVGEYVLGAAAGTNTMTLTCSPSTSGGFQGTEATFVAQTAATSLGSLAASGQSAAALALAPVLTSLTASAVASPSATVATPQPIALTSGAQSSTTATVSTPQPLGQLAFALVGSPGGVTPGGTGASVTPSWDAGALRTAGDLLVLLVLGTHAATLPVAPSGWLTAAQQPGTSMSVSIFYKIAAGSDAAPVIAGVTGVNLAAELIDFSGASPLVEVALDQIGGAADLTGSTTAVAASPDRKTGEVLIAASGAYYSLSQAATLTDTANNATLATVTNNGSSSTNHWAFAWGITTSFAAADQDVFAYTTTNLTGSAVALASFRNPALGSVGKSSASAAVSIPALVADLGSLSASAVASAAATVAAPQPIPLAASSAVAAPTLALAPVLTGLAASAQAGATATITVPAVLGSLTAGAVASATAVVSAKQPVALAASTSVAAATLALAPVITGMAATGQSSATATVAAKQPIALATTAQSSATLGLTVPGVAFLTLTTSGLSSTTATVAAPARLTLTAVSAVASATGALAPVLSLTVGGQSSATGAVRTPLPLPLGSSSGQASASSLGFLASLGALTATAQSSATVTVAVPQRLLLGAAAASATATLTVSAAGRGPSTETHPGLNGQVVTFILGGRVTEIPRAGVVAERRRGGVTIQPLRGGMIDDGGGGGVHDETATGGVVL